MTGRALRVLVVAVLAGCTTGTPAPPSGGSPVSVSPSPATSSLPATAIPEPTLTDPGVIGAALLDPDRAADGVVSLLALLGIGIYGADNSPVRKGAETGPLDPWLFDDEVRGLIELATADAAALRDGGAPATLGDLVAPLVPLVQGSDPDALLGRYAAAYAAAPTRAMAQVVGAMPWAPATPASRAVLWFLLIDGLFGTRAGSTALSGPWAVTAALGGPPGIAAVPAGSPVLPPIPSPDPRLTIDEWNLLMSQLPLLGYRVPFEVLPGSARGHEGHGAPGDTLTFDAKWLPQPAPLVSPFNGTPLLLPAPLHLDGLLVSWRSANEGVFNKHGTTSVPFGGPTTTDALGKARFTYSMRKEPANGSGDQQAASPIVVATVDMRALISAMYLVPPAALAFINGERTAFSVALLEWHEGKLALELEIDSTVTPTLVSGYGVVQGKAMANGRIQLSRGDAPTGPWTGDGTLSSQTTSGTGGCPGVHIAGQGAYDWVVRAAIAGPEVTNAADIAVDMDAGPANEQPDQFTLNDCVTSFSGQMNTWENQFFTAYRHRYGANGLHVGDWSLQATADTWKTGGLVATATWSGTCATNLSPLEQKAFACTDTTTFKLWAVAP